VRNIDLPINSALELIPWPGQFQASVVRWVSSSHPIARLLPEAFAYQKDPFTHADIGPQAQATLKGLTNVVESLNTNPVTRPVYQWLEAQPWKDPRTGDTYTRVNAAKWYILARALFLSRFTATGERMGRIFSSEDPAYGASLLDLIGGFRADEFDLTRRQEANIRRMMRVVEKQAVRAGVYPEFRKRYFSSGR
jgi:hypothetical protein